MSPRLRACTRAALVALCLVLSTAPCPAADAGDPAKQRVFLEALSHIEAGKYAAAIALLRAMLSTDPDLHRVRLELARAHFLAGEWERARREFFTVLSADIPAPVRTNIIAFLREIDARRGWDWELDFAIVSGAGLTRRHRSDSVTLAFGGIELPFAIERPKAPDFGVEIGGYVELRETLVEGTAEAPRITGGVRAALALQEFTGSAFDDHRLWIEAPLRFSFPERTVTIGPFGAYRWLGGDPHEREIGALAELTDRSLAPWSVVLNAFASHVDGLGAPARDGARYGAGATVLRSIGGRAIAGASVGTKWMAAAEDFESYTELQGSLLLSADLRHGLNGTIQPRLIWQRFDGAAPFFPAPRRDWQAGAVIQLTKADFTLLGFSPFVSYEFAYRDSNIELFRYTDHIVRVGFTKTF